MGAGGARKGRGAGRERVGRSSGRGLCLLACLEVEATTGMLHVMAAHGCSPGWCTFRRKLSDKTEFGSEAAANHPRAFIFFEQFPEGVIRLAALRYEWRPPENMGEAKGGGGTAHSVPHSTARAGGSSGMPVGLHGTPRICPED